MLHELDSMPLPPVLTAHTHAHWTHTCLHPPTLCAGFTGGFQWMLHELDRALNDQLRATAGLGEEEAEEEGEEQGAGAFAAFPTFPLSPGGAGGYSPREGGAAGEAGLTPRGRRGATAAGAGAGGGQGSNEGQWGSAAAAQAVRQLQGMGAQVYPPGDKDKMDWGILAG